MASAVDAFKQGNWERAVELFTAALDHTSDAQLRYTALNNRAASFAKLGRYEEALHDADAMMKLLPLREEGHFKKIEFLRALGNYVEAISALGTALSVMGSKSIPPPLLGAFAAFVKGPRLFDLIADLDQRICADMQSEYERFIQVASEGDAAFAKEDNEEYLHGGHAAFQAALKNLRIRAALLDIRQIDAALEFRDHLIFHVELLSRSHRNYAEHLNTAWRSTIPFCSFCLRDDRDSSTVTVRACSRCHIASYCSVDCQRQDWTLHRVQCGGLAQTIANKGDELAPVDALRLLQRFHPPIDEGTVRARQCLIADGVISVDSWDHVWSAIRVRPEGRDLVHLTDMLTFPMTILFALKTFNIVLDASRTWRVHVVGASPDVEQSAAIVAAFAYLQLMLQPFVLAIDFIGPLCFDRVYLPNNLRFHRGLYQDVAVRLDAPDLVVMFHPGLQYRTLYPSWNGALHYLIGLYVPMFVTAWTDWELKDLKESFITDSHVLGPYAIETDGTNPFASLFCRPDRVNMNVMRHNKRYMTFRGRGAEYLRLEGLSLSMSKLYGVLNFNNTDAESVAVWINDAKLALDAWGDQTSEDHSLLVQRGDALIKRFCVMMDGGALTCKRS